ncbi:MAG TPA: DUF1559 domain-containing protein [Candidatus Solibacter sp.]|nr:DUF1559 domain-containing protein [Candidatus Solibacter sp.]
MSVPRRSAFTLTELLVVIAIIVVLLGLLIPGVMQIRAMASKTKCANNLRQIGLALHMYHESKRSFPAGMRYSNGRDPYYLMSWQAQLLPYIEEASVWEMAEQDYKSGRNPLNPPHRGLATRVPLYICPSDPQADQVQIARRELYVVALTSYLGVSGKDLSTLDGVFFRDSHTNFDSITDGTSKTLLVGERPASPDYQFGWWYAGAGQNFTGSADMFLGVTERNVLPAWMAPCPPGPYQYGPGRLDNQCDMFHFWSLHSGGANFVFADCHVQFIAYSGVKAMPALATRAGRDNFGLEDY